MPSSEESILLNRIKSGNEEAFERIFNDYWHLLFTFAHKLLRSYDDAQDVVQLVYISFWQRRATLNITGSLQNYLLQSVRFQSLKRLKAILAAPGNIERVQEDFLPVFNDIIERQQTTDMFREIEEKISKFPQRTQEIFLLSRKHQLSITEIAQQLNLSEQTVKNQLHRVLKALRHPIACVLIFTDLFHR